MAVDEVRTERAFEKAMHKHPSVTKRITVTTAAAVVSATIAVLAPLVAFVFGGIRTPVLLQLSFPGWLMFMLVLAARAILIQHMGAISLLRKHGWTPPHARQEPEGASASGDPGR